MGVCVGGWVWVRGCVAVDGLVETEIERSFNRKAVKEKLFSFKS